MIRAAPHTSAPQPTFLSAAAAAQPTDRSPLLWQAASDELDELDTALEQEAGRGGGGGGGGASGSAAVCASGSAAPSAGDELPPGWIERSRRLLYAHTHAHTCTCTCACTLSVSRPRPPPPPRPRSRLGPRPCPRLPSQYAHALRLRSLPSGRVIKQYQGPESSGAWAQATKGTARSRKDAWRQYDEEQRDRDRDRPDQRDRPDPEQQVRLLWP